MNFLKAFSLVILIGLNTPLAMADEKPNIIFIMVDDLGPEWLSCYGADDISTPNIDALAASGMRFDAAYSMPKCTPTRVTLLTGQYPYRHGWVNHWDVPRWGMGMHFDAEQNLSFARLLQDAGYRTAIAGKWQINDFRVEPDVLASHGFEDWCMWTGYETGNPPSNKRFWDAYVHTRDGSSTHEDAFGPDVYTDFLLDFMDRNHDEPMLLYFPMALTHTPFVHTPLEPKAKTNLEKHKAMVRYVDHCVGRITAKLDTLGIREKTYLFFTTDNGTTRGITGHLKGREVKGGKGELSERGCRAPFIVSCPERIPVGTATSALTDFTDLFPTFCTLAGIDIPETHPVDGHSIVPILHGDSTAGSRDWIMAMGGGVARLNGENKVVPDLPYAARTLRNQRYKLILDPQGKAQALYDLQEDPGETGNLITTADESAQAALNALLNVAKAFPKQDAVPRYTPNPPQNWDTDPNAKAKPRS